ncbi:MAG: N-acetyltransferase family protein [Nocardioides sp.]
MTTVPGGRVVTVRSATVGDADACATIFEPYVTDTPVTFDYQPPDATEFARRIQTYQQRHGFMVAEMDSEVVGFAYAAPYMARAAYDWSCFTSVYLRVGLRRTGAGSALYDALLPQLRDAGMQVAIAGITLPNEASMGFHASYGFEEIGVQRRIGWKLGHWWDVWLGQLELSEPHAPEPV